MDTMFALIFFCEESLVFKIDYSAFLGEAADNLLKLSKHHGEAI